MPAAEEPRLPPGATGGDPQRLERRRGAARGCGASCAHGVSRAPVIPPACPEGARLVTASGPRGPFPLNRSRRGRCPPQIRPSLLALRSLAATSARLPLPACRRGTMLAPAAARAPAAALGCQRAAGMRSLLRLRGALPLLACAACAPLGRQCLWLAPGSGICLVDLFLRHVASRESRSPPAANQPPNSDPDGSGHTHTHEQVIQQQGAVRVSNP